MRQSIPHEDTGLRSHALCAACSKSLERRSAFSPRVKGGQRKSVRSCLTVFGWIKAQTRRLVSTPTSWTRSSREQSSCPHRRSKPVTFCVELVIRSRRLVNRYADGHLTPILL